MQAPSEAPEVIFEETEISQEYIDRKFPGFTGA